MDEIFFHRRASRPVLCRLRGLRRHRQYFIGLGKTGYNAVNSLLINLGYYGAFYALFRARAIMFDMQTIILMFGFGMVAHYVISLMQERLFLRRRI